MHTHFTNNLFITLLQIFDRDEPAKEKEVYVTVQASDNGNPRLDAVCTLKVKITDINDNTGNTSGVYYVIV